MALTAGQRAWLDAQIGERRIVEAEGRVAAHRRDGDDHVYSVELEDGRGMAALRYAAPTEPPGDPADLIGEEARVGIDGEVTEWREVEGDVELHVVAADGSQVWEQVNPPRPQEELDADAATAQAAAEKARAARQAVLDRVRTARGKGAQRTAGETATMLNDLATLMLDAPTSAAGTAP